MNYQIDVSVDGGLTWKSAVKDWTISRRGDEPKLSPEQRKVPGVPEIPFDGVLYASG